MATIHKLSFFVGIEVNGDKPHLQENLEAISNLTKTSRITALDWSLDKSEIFVGRTEPVVKVYSLLDQKYIETSSVEKGPITGVAKFNGKLITGLADGRIQIGDNEESTHLTTGDSMSRLRQCQVEPKLIATGGKDRINNLKVWNLETNECVFKTKNIPNDHLQLEVPVWDTDVNFFDANCLATCSRFGYVRMYDIRKQRRPIGIHKNDQEQIGYTSLALHENIIFCGTTLGIMRAFDIRKMKQILHTYKGFTGSISDVQLDESGKYLCSASLDRFVRIHEVESTILQYQCYVKSKATRVLIRKSEPNTDIKLEDESDEEIGTEENYDDLMTEDESDTEFNDIFDQMQTIE